MSPSRKKPAYLIGSSYAADYDNAMEMVHGQVAMFHIIYLFVILILIFIMFDCHFIH